MVRTLITTVAGLFLFAALVQADDKSSSDQGTKVKGTIKKVDTDQKTITVTLADGTEKEFKVNEQTRCIHRSAEGGAGAGGDQPQGGAGGDMKTWMSNLQEGAKVTLMLDSEGSTTVREIRVGGGHSGEGR